MSVITGLMKGLGIIQREMPGRAENAFLRKWRLNRFEGFQVISWAEHESLGERETWAIWIAERNSIRLGYGLWEGRGIKWG